MKNFSLAAASILVTLVALESLFYAVEFHESRLRQNGLKEMENVWRRNVPGPLMRDTDTLFRFRPEQEFPGYMLVPSLSGYEVATYPFRTSRLGFRAPFPDGDEWNKSVLFLGDSVTFGVGVGDDETFSARVGLKLASSTGGWRGINLGMPAFNTYQEYRTLAKWGDELKAGMVMVQICENDTEPPMRVSASIEGYPERGDARGYLFDDREVDIISRARDSIYRPWLDENRGSLATLDRKNLMLEAFYRSRLVRFTAGRLRDVPMFSFLRQEPHAALREEWFVRVFSYMLLIKDWCDERGIPVVFCYLPKKGDLYAGALPFQISILEEWSVLAGLEFKNAVHYMETNDGKRLFLEGGGDFHLSVNGHSAMAGFFLEMIGERASALSGGEGQPG